MTSEQQTEPQATEEPQAEQAQAQQSTEPDEETKRLANEQLRQYADSVKEENKGLRKMAMKTALGEIGLSPEEGLGVAIVDSYDGDITEEAIAAYAEEKYKYNSGQAPTPPSVDTGDRLEQLQQVGASVEPKPPESEGDKAVQKVDSNDPDVDEQAVKSSLAAKVGQFTSEHYG